MKRLLYLLAIVPVLLFGCSDFDPEDYEFTTPAWLRGTWICPWENEGYSGAFKYEIEEHEIKFYNYNNDDNTFNLVATFSDDFNVASERRRDANTVYELIFIPEENENQRATYTWYFHADGTVSAVTPDLLSESTCTRI